MLFGVRVSDCRSILNDKAKIIKEMICVKCKLPKKYFPVYKVNGKYYIRKYCPDCWEEMARVRARKYYNDHLEEYRKYKKKIRKTPEFKKWRKEYNKKNRDTINLQNRIRVKKYNEAQSKNLTDYYVKKVMKRHDKNLIEIPTELIEIKRCQIQIKRLCKNGK